MLIMKTKSFILILWGLLFSIGGFAQDFVYTPINSSFGGNPYNASWMLSKAEAQNGYEAPVSDDETDDALESFSENMNAQILSELQRKIMEEQFGEFNMEEGEYTIGQYQISVANDVNGVNVNIFDTNTGGETTVTVPYY